MNKQDMLKIQTCVLRVNIHCEGCKHKVKKKLQKVEGVYKVSIDEEQGKAIVSGNVDPATLINKLEKAGKHAELWGPQKGPISILNNNQLKNIQFDNIKGIKAQKGGKDQHKNGFQLPQQQQMHPKKGMKDEKFSGKDQKSVKFKLPEDEEEEDEYDDDDFDEFDEDDDDEFDDEFDEGFAAHQPPPSKVAPVGNGPKSNKAASKGHVKGNNGGNSGGKAKKVGGGFDKLLKGMLGKAGGKNGGGGKNSKKGGNKKEDRSNNSTKNGGDGKNGKGGGHKGNGGGKANEGWSKKGGENFDGGPKFGGKQQGFNDINVNFRSGGGGGRNMDPMAQMGGFPAVQGLPAAAAAAAAAMNAGRYQGQGNPYNQQYMAHMMMMNQQGGNGYDAYHPLAYMRPQPAMSYGPPPPATDHYTHMFSDENTGSCSIM